MIGLRDLRRHDRHRLRGFVDLSWNLPGGQKSAVTGNCLDVSVYGMLVESPSPIAAGTKLTAKLQQSGVEGEAIVRHCKQHGPWFRVGLKFGSALLLEENVRHIKEPLLK